MRTPLESGYFLLFPKVSAFRGSTVFHFAQDYVSYYKHWNSALPPPMKILCPIDHSKRSSAGSSGDDEQPKSKDADSAGSSRATGGGGAARLSSRRSGSRGRGMPNAQSMNINGRRMLICSVNGIYLQVCNLEVQHYSLGLEVDPCTLQLFCITPSPLWSKLC